MNSSIRFISAAIALAVLIPPPIAHGEDVGDRWGTAERERAFYRVVNIPMPEGMVLEAGAFELLPDQRIAVGTRRGDIYFISLPQR